MKTNYLIIDLENVHPDNLALVNGVPWKVKVFLGANQTKVNVGMARALQALGADAVEYITIEGNGKNALDFHIAFFMGQLAAKDSNAFFHIISKDTGFDPLIKYLKSRNILCQRSSSVADVPLVKLVNSKSLPDKVEAIVANLTRRKSARPRRVKTLDSTVKALFQGQLTDAEVTAIREALVKRGAISIDGEKVGYNLDA
jgi:hypothetical protein